MPNIRLTIEFDGRNYAGWQYQPDRPTVQGQLQAALKRIFGEELIVYGCGRTDAGVSARNYVVSFFAPDRLPVARIASALNFYLPRDILVKSAERVPDGFHARFSVKTKTYRYYIICGRSALRRQFAWEVYQPLDLTRLRDAARLFVGTRDFCRFCSIPSGRGICTIKSVRVKKKADEIVITIIGDRFLYKMVRRIVGAMVAYATGRLSQRDISAALAGKNHRPFQTAPGHGLILESVHY
ncbi:MAG: tRNA pseudouridine(38-40) synthase TruA [bacterium]